MWQITFTESRPSIPTTENSTDPPFDRAFNLQVSSSSSNSARAKILFLSSGGMKLSIISSLSHKQQNTDFCTYLVLQNAVQYISKQQHAKTAEVEWW